MADARGDRLIPSILALLTSSATGAALGLVFWAVAAHVYSARSVGLGAAAIAAMTLLASIAQLNLNAIFPRFLYASGAHAMRILVAGYAASAALAVVAAAIFLTLTGHHSYIGGGALPPLIFGAAVVLWVVFTIEDAALIGLRAAFWVPVENTSFSLAKVVLLPILVVSAPSTGVFYSWTLPVIACVIPVNYYLFRKVLPRHVADSAGRSSLPTPRVAGAMVAGEYLGSLSVVALTALPALLVVAKLGAIQTAYFQTPWLIGTSFDMIVFGIATSLLVESSARPTVAPDLVRRAVRLGCLLLFPATVVLFVGAPLILSVLGDGYAAHGTALLRWLALSLPFVGVDALYLAFARLGRRVRRVVTLQVGSAVFILVLIVVLLGHLGITGAGVAFTSGQVLVACIVFPSVLRQYRRPAMAPGFAPDGPLVVHGSMVDAEGGVLPEDPAPLTATGFPPAQSVVVAHKGGPASAPPMSGLPWWRHLGANLVPPERRVQATVTLAVLLLDVLALVAAVADLHGAIRVILGLALVLVVPGWSAVGLMRLADPLLAIGLSLAVSLAVCIVAAQIALTLHAWHPVALQEVVCLVCLPFLLWQLMAPPGEAPA
jgi:O-antigen/teichoic acid export membrane protein